jgi:cytoskeletal protein RodZ
MQWGDPIGVSGETQSVQGGSMISMHTSLSVDSTQAQWFTVTVQNSTASASLEFRKDHVVIRRI